MSFQTGLEVFLNEKTHIEYLKNKSVALVAGPASVTTNLDHALDLFHQKKKLYLTAGFGAQHGLKGEKQYNMEETQDEIHPFYNIPIYSLYGEVRRPTKKMLDSFEVLFFDLQDIGCRIYTYLATLIYLMEDLNKYPDKELWVLDRPNLAGRFIEGSYLEPEWETFVGAAPLLMRHGLTLGEVAIWYKKIKKLEGLNLKVIPMKDYHPDQSPYFGWPQSELPFVNPSPNIPNIHSAIMFSGTVLLEGTPLSEGRGTTVPLQVMGAPEIEGEKVVKKMYELKSEWLKGCLLRPCFFEPTFNKHKGKICSGFQIHLDHFSLNPKEFRPYRLMAVFFKAVQSLYPDYKIWDLFPYEYETDKMPIDMLTGSEFYKKWVEDKSSDFNDLDNYLKPQEEKWENERREFLLY